jgi:hypothetical protein
MYVCVHLISKRVVKVNCMYVCMYVLYNVCMYVCMCASNLKKSSKS